MALPPVVKWYLNHHILNDIGDYKGRVDDVDIALWRGAYQLNDLTIEKKVSALEKPFVVIPTLDLSVQWKALLNGAIVAEIEVRNPTVNFAFSDNPEKAQTGAEENWVEVIQEITPVKINRFAVINGTLALNSVVASPPTDLPLESFQLEILNIQNTIDKSVALPTTITVSGRAAGYNSDISIDAKAMLLKEVPDFDYNLKIETVDLKALNPIIEYETGMDFEAGTISLYSEMAMKDGRFEGYIKPILKDLKLFKFREKDRKFRHGLKEFFVGGVQWFTENKRNDQFATKIPIEGTLENTDPDISKTVINTLHNAYIKALDHQLDETVNYEQLKDKKKDKSVLN